MARYFTPDEGGWVTDRETYAALPVEVRCVTRTTYAGGDLLRVEPALSKEMAASLLLDPERTCGG
jgi:hypothetical protein